jgi:hypothetical protein
LVDLAPRTSGRDSDLADSVLDRHAR